MSRFGTLKEQMLRVAAHQCGRDPFAWIYNSVESQARMVMNTPGVEFLWMTREGGAWILPLHFLHGCDNRFLEQFAQWKDSARLHHLKDGFVLALDEKGMHALLSQPHWTQRDGRIFDEYQRDRGHLTWHLEKNRRGWVAFYDYEAPDNEWAMTQAMIESWVYHQQSKTVKHYFAIRSVLAHEKASFRDLNVA